MLKVTRKTCAFTGCSRLGRNKGKNACGIVRYGKYCTRHHRLRGTTQLWRERSSINNDVCEKCGWKEAPCDRHRIDSKKGYVKKNVLILCPNCHRVESLKNSSSK